MSQEIVVKLAVSSFESDSMTDICAASWWCTFTGTRHYSGLGITGPRITHILVAGSLVQLLWKGRHGGYSYWEGLSLGAGTAGGTNPLLRRGGFSGQRDFPSSCRESGGRPSSCGCLNKQMGSKKKIFKYRPLRRVKFLQRLVWNVVRGSPFGRN